MNLEQISEKGFTVTNKEINEAFGDALNIPEGQKASPVYVAAVVKNPDHQNTAVLFVQNRNDVRTGTTSNEENAFFLGWDNTRTVRYIRQVADSLVKKLDLKPGTQMHGWNLQIVQNLKKAYPNQDCRRWPMGSDNEGEPITFKGDEVYEHISMVTGQPTHALLEPDEVEVTADVFNVGTEE